MPKMKKGRERTKLPLNLVTILLTECGYRCAVPTCRGILALDMHHIWEVNEGGPDDASNLVALCPTCHALYHRGTIQPESIYAWKAMLVAVSRAFDVAAIDQLMFLKKLRSKQLAISGDGVLQFSRLIAAGLVTFELLMQNGPLVLYEVKLANKGVMMIDAWESGDRVRLETALTPIEPTRPTAVPFDISSLTVSQSQPSTSDVTIPELPPPN